VKLKSRDGPWKVHPYRELAKVPEKKPLLELPSRSLYEEINKAAVLFYQMEYTHPKVVYLGTNKYSDLLKEMYDYAYCRSVPFQHPCTVGYRVGTLVGILTVKMDATLHPDAFRLAKEG